MHQALLSCSALLATVLASALTLESVIRMELFCESLMIIVASVDVNTVAAQSGSNALFAYLMGQIGALPRKALV